ncbi:MAG: glycosyltransferase [Candidatus Coatesbacteria bacterium]|nr:MAG: glycosyltransferase [Candidatus Coatesbacteria bacterium]
MKLAKYLPEFGYTPVVLAADNPRKTDSDPVLLEQIPPCVRVFRVPVADPFAGVASLYKTFKNHERGNRGSRERKNTGESFGTRLKRFFSFPDPQFRFLRPALSAFFRIPDVYRLTAVINTAPPYTGHMLGARLSRITRLPLVLDYRDAWTYNPFGGAPTAFHAVGWRLAEQRVLSAASAVVTVTDTMADDYRRRFRLDAPVITIPNGYDEDDFEGVVPERRGKFTVVYAGTFYAGRDPFTFLDGVRLAIASGVFGADDIEIRFIGAASDDVLAAVKASGLPVVMRTCVPHRDAVSEIVSAHASLLIIGDGPAMGTTLTGKIFEYLRAGRPVIAMVPPGGEAARLIVETDGGYVVSPDDADGVAAVLTELYGRYKQGELNEPGTPNSVLKRYDRREIARAYAELLDSLIGD